MGKADGIGLGAERKRASEVKFVEAGRAQVGKVYFLPAVGWPCTCEGLSGEKDGDGDRYVSFRLGDRRYLCHPSLDVSVPEEQ